MDKRNLLEVPKIDIDDKNLSASEIYNQLTKLYTDVIDLVLAIQNVIYRSEYIVFVFPALNHRKYGTYKPYL